jgi:hypothetical protein
LAQNTPGERRQARGQRPRPREVQIDPPVLLALLLDLAKAHPTDLAGAAHMGAAAGLKVDRSGCIRDPHKPYPPGPSRWLDGHGLHKAGIGVQLGVGDPLGRHCQIAGNQGIEFGLERILVLGAFRHIEIEPPLVGPDRPAGYGKRDHHRQKMQRGMNPHMPMPCLPVDHLLHLGPQWRQNGRFGGEKNNRSALALHRGRDRRLAAIPGHPARVSGLAAGGGVKDRPVKNNPALIRQANDSPDC